MRAMKSQSRRAALCSPEEFREAFGRDRPGVDPVPVLRSVRGFADWRGYKGWPMPVPDRTEISGYLGALSSVERQPCCPVPSAKLAGGSNRKPGVARVEAGASSAIIFRRVMA